MTSAMEDPIGGRKKFRAANGASMEHYGQKSIKFKVPGAGDDRPKSIRFQVPDVKRPLVSVARIVKLGHVVKFGTKEEDNFIENPATGEKNEDAQAERGLRFLNEAEVSHVGFAGRV
mgnify:CR=1 FL=1